MSLQTQIVEFTVPTSGATVDVTSSGFGTPVAAIFVSASMTTEPNAGSQVLASLGFTDGTAQRCITAKDRDAVNTTDSYRFAKTNQVLQCTFGSSNGVDWSVDFNQWITDGVELGITNSPSTARKCICILIGGDGVQASIDDSNQISGTVTTGHPVDLAFAISAGASSSFNGDHAVWSFGCAIDDGSDTNYSTGWGSVDNQSTSKITSKLWSGEVGSQTHNDLTPWSATIDTFTATGYDLTFTATGTDDLSVLAINTNGAQLSLDTISTPTATGTKKTSIGFEPAALIASFMSVQSVDSVKTDEEANAFGFSYSDGTVDSAFSWFSRDGVGTMVTGRSQQDKFALVYDNDAHTIEGTIDSFDSDGFTIDYTTVDTSALYGWVLAIGDPSAPSEQDFPFRRYYSGGLSL